MFSVIPSPAAPPPPLPEAAERPRRFRTRQRWAAAAALAAALSIGFWGWHWRSTRALRVFPGKYWEQVTPESVGMDGQRLARLSRTLRGSGCIVRGGKMAYHWGHPELRSNVWSASKPFIAHALFAAVVRGLLPSLDAPVADSQPGLHSLNADLQYKDRQITWRHLVSQTSCYGVSEAPGRAFDYSDFQMALLIDTLFEKVYQVSDPKIDREVMEPMLYRDIQFQDSPTLGRQGQHRSVGRLHISPRDFCRFGLLYLRGGQWDGKPLLPESWIHLARASPLPPTLARTAGTDATMLEGQRSLGGGKNQEDAWGSYSYTWWTNGCNAAGERLWPDAPTDTFGAFGQAGKWALVIIPSLDLVASWVDTTLPGFTAMSWNETGRLPLSRILHQLARTVRDRH